MDNGIPLVADLLLLAKSTFSTSVIRMFFKEIVGSGDEGVVDSGLSFTDSVKSFGSDRLFLVWEKTAGVKKEVCVWCFTVAASTAVAAEDGIWSVAGCGGGGELLGATMTDCRNSVGVEVGRGEQAEVELTTGGEVGGVVLQEKHCEGFKICNCSSIFACFVSRFRAMRSFISAFSSSLRIHS